MGVFSITSIIVGLIWEISVWHDLFETMVLIWYLRLFIVLSVLSKSISHSFFSPIFINQLLSFADTNYWYKWLAVLFCFSVRSVKKLWSELCVIKAQVLDQSSVDPNRLTALSVDAYLPGALISCTTWIELIVHSYVTPISWDCLESGTFGLTPLFLGLLRVFSNF